MWLKELARLLSIGNIHLRHHALFQSICNTLHHNQPTNATIFFCLPHGVRSRFSRKPAGRLFWLIAGGRWFIYSLRSGDSHSTLTLPVTLYSVLCRSSMYLRDRLCTIFPPPSHFHQDTHARVLNVRLFLSFLDRRRDKWWPELLKMQPWQWEWLFLPSREMQVTCLLVSWR